MYVWTLVLKESSNPLRYEKLTVILQQDGRHLGGATHPPVVVPSNRENVGIYTFFHLPNSTKFALNLNTFRGRSSPTTKRGSDSLLGKDLIEVHVHMHTYILPTLTLGLGTCQGWRLFRGLAKTFFPRKIISRVAR